LDTIQSCGFIWEIKLPEALVVIIGGIILGWATGLNKPGDVTEAAKLSEVVWSSVDSIGYI
jgi:ABC-type sulfate transport system permease component